MTDKSRQLTLTEAIELLKDYRKGDFVGDDEFCKAIDTVLKEVEKPLPTDDEILERANKSYSEEDPIEYHERLAFKYGAIWMRDLRKEETK